MIDMGLVKISADAYRNAGGNPDYITTGLCDSPDCQSAYVLFASCGDPVLAEQLKSGLEKIVDGEEDV